MLKWVLLVIGALLLAFSAEPLYYAATNRQQVTVTCDAFATAPPRALWLRVTGCEMDYLGAGYREWGGRIVELYFPARPVGRPRTDPAPLVASTRDASVLTLAEETIGTGRTPDQEQFLVMMLKIVTALRASREIEGYARGTLLQRLSSRSALAGLTTPVGRDVLVVDLHTKPGLAVPAASAAVGTLLIAGFVMLRTRARAAPAPTPRVVEPETAHAVEGTANAVEATNDAIETTHRPAPSATVRVRVMLLNLPAHAGPEAIETAAPLGSGADVVAALTRAAPGLHFEASGRAAVDGPDCVLAVDIGPTDPVQTAVIDAQGTGALTILQRILERTRWRAFEPKTGKFLSTERLPSAGHTAA